LRSGLGGIEVGLGWGALFLQPDSIQRVGQEDPLPHGGGDDGSPQSASTPAMQVLRPRRVTRLPKPVSIPLVPAHVHDQQCPPELDPGEDFYYDNPELVFSKSENEEQVEDEFYLDEEGERYSNPVDPNSIKHLYRNGTWSQFTNEYTPETIPFSGDLVGVKKTYWRMPSFLHLFGIFWTRTVLRNICMETNRYAREVQDGKSKGGEEWYDVDEKELRTFLAVSLYMGMKTYTTEAFSSIAKMFAFD
jgi:hypothetical protein